MHNSITGGLGPLSTSGGDKADSGQPLGQVKGGSVPVPDAAASITGPRELAKPDSARDALIDFLVIVCQGIEPQAEPSDIKNALGRILKDNPALLPDLLRSMKVPPADAAVLYRDIKDKVR